MAEDRELCKEQARRNQARGDLAGKNPIDTGQAEGEAREAQPFRNQARSWAEAAGPGSRVEVHQDMVDWTADTEEDKTQVAHMGLEDHMKMVEAVEVDRDPVRIGRKPGCEPEEDELAACNPRALEDREVGTAAGPGSGDGKVTEAVDRMDLGAGPEREPGEDKVRPVPKHWYGEGIEAAAVRIWSRQDRLSTSNYQTLSLRRLVQVSPAVVGETRRRRCNASQRQEQWRRGGTSKA